MQNPLIIFRLGWMDDYSGKGEIIGGGSHIKENGEGGEMWNFREEAGRHYGYVMSKNFAGIDLNRISSQYLWEKGDELENVDIVFISTHPDGGQFVTGWYLGATIYHKEYRKRRGSKNQDDWNNIEYLSEVRSEFSNLLPTLKRTFPIPKGKGFPGTSNVWYGDDEIPHVNDFKNQLRDYIYCHNNKTNNLPTKKTKPSKDLILAIEIAAIQLTWEYYESLGYNVITVEKDNAGWDLEATRGSENLLLEVKGHKGNVIQFELTPNEYFQLQNNLENYRVCVVRNALDKPDLIQFYPIEDEEYWYLKEVDGTEIIRLQEKIAAKAVQIDF
ncbi:DUF3883 domain-containing protein [Acinetobacter johnsonii]|uniref:protein NO VEIN domain-containing protein n=1 Tax=Acinetobacter johnsonii TaxID=40214 RepID=UPI0030AC8C2E